MEWISSICWLIYCAVPTSSRPLQAVVYQLMASIPTLSREELAVSRTLNYHAICNQPAIRLTRPFQDLKSVFSQSDFGFLHKGRF